MNEFVRCHPLVNFFYFAFVIGFSMFLMHPICLVISLLAGAVYAVLLGGKKNVRMQLMYLLPLVLLMVIMNGAINHRGATILCYLPSGNPLTLESVLYGMAAAGMLAAVVCHFSCLHHIMTSDKLMYLFGRILPSLSLVFSMVLRFVPRLSAELKEVRAAQKCIGRDVTDGRFLQKMKNGMKIFSVMLSRSLENAPITADSMKSRGFGLPHRTAYTCFVFDARDAKMLAVTLCAAAYVLAGSLRGALAFTYFPTVSGFACNAYTISLMLAYAALCFLPIGFELREVIRWKKLQSKM